MINLALASLALLGPSVDSSVAEAPPLKIWISNNRSFRPGNAVKVQVETGKTGYLLVLHFAPSGQLSVLFPLSPGDDNLVQTDRRYEVRDGGGSVSFVADGSGPGLVFSAISDDPWQLESVTLNGAWDYGALTIARDTKDPEADITALVQRLSSSRGFDYDVLDYAVYGDRGGDASPPPSWWSPTYNDGYADCGCYGSSIYVGFGFSFGWPWYWYPHYAPYSYYGYYPGYGYPYYPYYPYYPPYYGHGHGHGGYYKYNTLAGRPRGYQVNPQYPNPNGRTRAGSRNVVTDGTGVLADGNGPARRARGGADRGGTRSGGDYSGAGRPSDNGSRGSNSGTRDATNPRSTGDHGDRARARPSGGEGRSSGRSGYSTTMTTPNVERSRPANRARGEWMRVDAASPSTSSAGARRVEQGTRIASNVPTRSDWSRAEAPQARRTYRPDAPRTRDVFSARPQVQGGGESRASGGGAEGRPSGGGEARARPGDGYRGGDARSSGGNRGGNTPSYAAPRGQSHGGGAPRMGGGGGGGSRGGFSGGGGGRARGGRP